MEKPPTFFFGSHKHESSGVAAQNLVCGFVDAGLQLAPAIATATSIARDGPITIY